MNTLPSTITSSPVRASLPVGENKFYESSHERKGIFEVLGEIMLVKVEPEESVVSSAVTTTSDIPQQITRRLKNVKIERLPEAFIAQLGAGIPLTISQISRLTAEFPETRSEPEEIPEISGEENIDNSCPLVRWSECALKILVNRSKETSAIPMYASLKMRNLYNDPSSVLREHLDKYEHWHSQRDTESITNYITKRTRIDKYNGSEYSMLWGENELKTRCWINEGEIIAHYGGQLLTEEEFERRCSTNCQFDFAPEDYAVGIEGTKLVLDGSHSNQVHCINDGTLKDDHGNKHDKRFNVELLILFKETETKQGTIRVPRVYVVANQKIPPDESVWLSYGSDFWTLWQKAQTNRQLKMQQSSQFVDNESFKHCKQIKVDSTIPEILRLVLHEKHLPEEVPELLSVDKSLNLVHRMFNRAIRLMAEAIDEAQMAGWLKKNISNAPGIINLAEFLNITGQELCDYMDIYEREYRFQKHVKMMFNTLLNKDYPSCWHLSRDTPLKPHTIKSYLQRFIDIYKAESNPKESLELISKTYKVTQDYARRWAGKIKTMKAMLNHPDPHHLEKNMDTDNQRHLKDIYIELYHNGHGHHSTQAENLIKKTTWSEQTSVNSIPYYLNDITELISSKNQININTLNRLGFTDEDISKLSKPRPTEQNKKREVYKHFFSLFLNPDALLNKEQAIQSTTKQFEGYTYRSELINELKNLRKKFQEDPSGETASNYYNLSDQTINYWKESLNNTTSKMSAIKRKRLDNESSTAQTKKIKYDDREESVKQELFSELYASNSSSQSRTDIKVKINHKYPQYSVRKINSWLKEFNNLAAFNNKEIIANTYSVEPDEAQRWLDNFAKKHRTTVRSGSSDEARNDFFTCYFIQNERKISKESGSEIVRKKYPGTTTRQVDNWISEWRKAPSVRSVNQEQVAKKYSITVDTAKSWLKGYQSTSRYKATLANDADQEKAIYQYFEAIYAMPNKRIPKDKAAQKISQETGASIRMLKGKHLRLEKLIADEESDLLIANKMSLTLEQVRQWSKVIK